MEINIVDKTVKKGDNCNIGAFSVIGKNTVLGNNVTIGNCVTVYEGTVIGDNCRIGDNSVLGKSPSVAATSTLAERGDLTGEKLPPLIIGNNANIGSCVVLYCGTKIGENVLIADLASIREKCSIGNFVIIGRGVFIENQCSVGDYTKFQAEAYLTALSTVEDNVFIAPCVCTSNDNYMARTKERFKHRKGAIIRSKARLGVCSVLLPGIEVGEEAVVAAGSVVTRNVPEGKVVMGAPAKVKRDVPEEQLLKNNK